MPTIDSGDEEIYTDSLTSHTTASDSTIGHLTSPLGPLLSRVEGPKVHSKTESQFSSSMPYLENSTALTPLVDSDTPSAINVSNSHDSVFVSDPSPDMSNLYPLLTPLCPSQEGTPEVQKGKPPERYGNIYTFDTLVDMGILFPMPM